MLGNDPPKNIGPDLLNDSGGVPVFGVLIRRIVVY